MNRLIFDLINMCQKIFFLFLNIINLPANKLLNAIV
jgi:hypothetical protein